MSFKRILFPVDFSERCRTVAPYVNAVAKREGATVTLASFVELPAVWFGAAEVPVMPELNIPRLVADAEHNLTFFGDEFFAGTPFNVVVAPNEPGAGIVDLVRNSGVDLVMMPTHGRGKFRAALIGSVTTKVLHDTSCPVWTAAHVEGTGYKPSPAWRNIVVAVESTPDALPLLRLAGEFSRTLGSAVQLVHAVPAPPEAGPERYFERDFDIFLRDSAQKSIEALQAEAGTAFPLTIEAGDTSAVLAGAARTHTADLVLIGRGVLPHLAGRIRSHVYEIIRDVPCPVLSI
jgi:nucleotide-binding universal stress UspA family protein